MALSRRLSQSQQRSKTTPDPAASAVHAEAPQAATLLQRWLAAPDLARPQDLPTLQRAYGNRAVTRLLQRAQAAWPEGGEIEGPLSQTIEHARGGGQPLDQKVNRQMSTALGANFGSVRVHTDPQADSLNQALSAKAFTVGEDILFSQCSYQAGSTTGQQLLAHELTHVVQQTGTDQSRVQRVRIRFIDDRWRRAKQGESAYNETTQISKYDLFKCLEEMIVQGDSEDLITEILAEQPQLTEAWKAYQELGPSVQGLMWNMLNERGRPATGKEILVAIDQALGKSKPIPLPESGIGSSGDTGSGLDFSISTKSRPRKSKKTKKKGDEGLKKRSKKPPKKKSEKGPKDKDTSDTSQEDSSESTRGYTEEELGLELEQLEQGVNTVSLQLQSKLIQIDLARDQVTRLHGLFDKAPTLQSEIDRLRARPKSSKFWAEDQKQAEELEKELRENPQALSEMQKARQSQMQKEREKTATLELDLAETLESVSQKIDEALNSLIFLGFVAKQFGFSQKTLNRVGAAMGRFANLMVEGRLQRPAMGELLQHIHKVLKKLDLPIAPAPNLIDSSDPETTHYTALSTTLEAPITEPNGRFREKALQKEERKRIKAALKRGVSKEDARVHARLEMILAKIEEAYQHTLLVSLGYEGNVLSVFVGPEWFFGGQQVCTPEQKDWIIKQLLIASLKYPHMLIVPGTILWSQDGQRVNNTAPVIINGQLKRAYSKKSWGGDPGGEELLERGHESNLFSIGNLHFAIDICADHAAAQAKQEYYARQPQGQGVDVHIISAAGQSARPEGVVARPGGAVLIADVEKASGLFGVSEGSTHEYREMEPQELVTTNPGLRSYFGKKLFELGGSKKALSSWEKEAKYSSQIIEHYPELKQPVTEEDDHERRQQLILQCLGYLEHVAQSGITQTSLKVLSEMQEAIGSCFGHPDLSTRHLAQYVQEEIRDFLNRIEIKGDEKERTQKVKSAKSKDRPTLTKEPSDLNDSLMSGLLKDLLHYAEYHITKNKKAPKDRLTAMQLQVKEIIDANQERGGTLLRQALFVQGRLGQVRSKKW